MDNTDFSTTILRWFAVNGRELPWRGITDAYAIWLSEVILQQTRISQGTAYWHNFMETYPTVAQLAAASEDDVLKLWQGLGYYSRARNLHAAAKEIAARGTFPSSYDDIRRLKGVGDYTAAAIASMAFGLPYAAVDGNVYRVLARHFGISTPINTTAGKREFQMLADRLCPSGQAGSWNQAMMDFGALVCTPSAPRCSDCPLAESCMALRQGGPGQYPVKQKNIRHRTRYFTYYYITREDKVLYHRRGKGDIWQGLWEPVLTESGTDETDDMTAAATPVLKHVLTHQTIFARMIRIDSTALAADTPLPCGAPPLSSLEQQYRWISASEEDSYAVPRLVERLRDML